MPNHEAGPVSTAVLERHGLTILVILITLPVSACRQPAATPAQVSIPAEPHTTIRGAFRSRGYAPAWWEAAMSLADSDVQSGSDRPNRQYVNLDHAADL